MSGDRDAADELAALMLGQLDAPRDAGAPVAPDNQPRRPRPDMSQGRGTAQPTDPATAFTQRLTDALDYPRPRWRQIGH